MERERSTVRRNSAERNWPTLSPTEQSNRVAGGKSGQKNGRSAVGGGIKKKAGEGGGSGQKRAAGEKTGSGQKKAVGERSGSGQKRAAGERSGSGQRKASGERSGSGQKKAVGEGSRQLKKAQSQPEVMTIRSGMRGTAYTNSGQEGRNQGYSRATGGQNRGQGHSTAAGGRNRAQGYSAAAGGQRRVSSRYLGEDELRRMQNRHTQNRKTSQEKRRHSARRSRHLIYAGMAAVCVLVLFLAAGRIGKKNSAEASGQSDMILAENKKLDESSSGYWSDVRNLCQSGRLESFFCRQFLLHGAGQSVYYSFSCDCS